VSAQLIEIKVADVILWHDYIIQRSNLKFGTNESSQCRDPQGLDGCIQGVFQGSTFTKSYYLNPPIEKMAGLLLHRIAEGQYFINGNKRIAVATAELFLRLNGYGLSYEDKDAEDLIISFAQPMNTQQARKDKSDSEEFIIKSIYPL
jgi:prophage maintenance system killer protein